MPLTREQRWGIVIFFLRPLQPSRCRGFFCGSVVCEMRQYE